MRRCPLSEQLRALMVKVVVVNLRLKKFLHRLDHRCVPPGMAHALSLKKKEKSYEGERFTRFTKGVIHSSPISRGADGEPCLARITNVHHVHHSRHRAGTVAWDASQCCSIFVGIAAAEPTVACECEPATDRECPEYVADREVPYSTHQLVVEGHLSRSLAPLHGREKEREI